jgi:hypothetical protein
MGKQNDIEFDTAMVHVIFEKKLPSVNKIIASFDHVLSCGSHAYEHHPLTLTDRMLQEVVDPSTSSHSDYRKVETTWFIRYSSFKQLFKKRDYNN